MASTHTLCPQLCRGQPEHLQCMEAQLMMVWASFKLGTSNPGLQVSPALHKYLHSFIHSLIHSFQHPMKLLLFFFFLIRVLMIFSLGHQLLNFFLGQTYYPELRGAGVTSPPFYR